MNNKSEISTHIIDDIYKWLILIFSRGKECCFRRKQHNFYSSRPSLVGGALIHSKALALSKKARDVTALLGVATL